MAPLLCLQEDLGEDHVDVVVVVVVIVGDVVWPMRHSFKSNTWNLSLMGVD